jgi:hypothetical protein
MKESHTDHQDNPQKNGPDKSGLSCEEAETGLEDDFPDRLEQPGVQPRARLSC